MGVPAMLWAKEPRAQDYHFLQDEGSQLQYFGHLMGRVDSLEKTLMLGKIRSLPEGRKRRGCLRMKWLDGITDSMDMGLGGLRSW